MTSVDIRPIEILFVEDNDGDIRLTMEALKDAKVRNNVSVVKDGVEAMAFLRRQGKYAEVEHPDIILLDLNLPKKDGREVLAEIKADEVLRRIPVLVFTMSSDEQDVLKAYDYHANAFITKPLDFDEFMCAVRSIEEFWLTIVKLPRKGP